MPPHLTEHLAQDRHVPGIFILNPNMNIGETIEELILIAQVSRDNEYLKSCTITSKPPILV